MLDTVLAVAIIVMRFICLMCYGALLVNSTYRLLHSDTDNEIKNVYMFIMMLTAALTYASGVSVYNWLDNLQNGDSDPGSQLTAFIAAVLFTVPGLFGLQIFKPWKVG